MDLQGQPISSGPRSTKVTNDPEAYRNPISEPSGPVANDSLAAESATHGGTFAQNRDAEPLGVSGSNSTFNNTDTSGATKLPPASVGTQREDINRQERYPEALGGQGDFPGPHPSQSGYVGGSTAMKEEYSAAHGGGDQQRSQYNAGQAPSYASELTGGLFGQGKPKGKNLQEGGFDSDPKYNASFNSEIGSQNDPGRVGENDMQRRVAESGPDAAGGPRQKGVENQHVYQNLAREQSA